MIHYLFSGHGCVRPNDVTGGAVLLLVRTAGYDARGDVQTGDMLVRREFEAKFLRVMVDRQDRVKLVYMCVYVSVLNMWYCMSRRKKRKIPKSLCT